MDKNDPPTQDPETTPGQYLVRMFEVEWGRGEKQFWGRERIDGRYRWKLDHVEHVDLAAMRAESLRRTLRYIMDTPDDDG